MSFLEDNGYLIFDGVKSSDYGVWINGRETFNAPARRYKEYVIPGRNGVLTIDEGAFEEQEVTYPAFIVDNFSANVQAFRNALMARNGYVRLTDSYHQDEFYLAKYMRGLEADVTPWGRAGKFDLTFKRDPRRFLLSGETPVEIEYNYMPYPYDGTTSGSGVTWSVTDRAITISGQTGSVGAQYYLMQDAILTGLAPGKDYKLSGTVAGKASVWLAQTNSGTTTRYVDYGQGVTFRHYSTARYTCYIVVPVNMTVDVTTTPTITALDAQPITNPTLFASNPLIRVTGSGTVGIGDNTITVGGGYSYVYIDSEIQNCYCGTQNANAIVSFSTGEFPTLPPGVTGITVGSGITSVQITPRWYRV